MVLNTVAALLNTLARDPFMWASLAGASAGIGVTFALRRTTTSSKPTRVLVGRRNVVPVALSVAIGLGLTAMLVDAAALRAAWIPALICGGVPAVYVSLVGQLPRIARVPLLGLPLVAIIATVVSWGIDAGELDAGSPVVSLELTMREDRMRLAIRPSDAFSAPESGTVEVAVDGRITIRRSATARHPALWFLTPIGTTTDLTVIVAGVERSITRDWSLPRARALAEAPWAFLPGDGAPRIVELVRRFPEREDHFLQPGRIVLDGRGHRSR